MADIDTMKGRAVLLFRYYLVTVKLNNYLTLLCIAALNIRNPYDSLISFWNHDRTQSYDGGPNKDGLKHLSDSINTQGFKNFVSMEIQLWEQIYLDYLTVGSYMMAMHYEDIKVI